MTRSVGSKHLEQNTDPVSDSSLLQMYESFVEEVDAVDNGISQCDGEVRYSISTTLSARVSHLNPRWNSTDQDTEVRLLYYQVYS